MEDKQYRKEMNSILDDLADAIMNIEGVCSTLEDELLDEDVTEDDRKVITDRLDRLDNILVSFNDIRKDLEDEEAEG